MQYPYGVLLVAAKPPDFCRLKYGCSPMHDTQGFPSKRWTHLRKDIGVRQLFETSEWSFHAENFGRTLPVECGLGSE